MSSIPPTLPSWMDVRPVVAEFRGDFECRGASMSSAVIILRWGYKVSHFVIAGLAKREGGEAGEGLKDGQSWIFCS